MNKLAINCIINDKRQFYYIKIYLFLYDNQINYENSTFKEIFDYTL